MVLPKGLLPRKPRGLEPIIAEKKASFAEYYGKPREAMRDEVICEKIEQIEREFSLPKKVDLLFRLCTPPKGYIPIESYSYDRDRLARIDDVRHGIIHRNVLGKPVQSIDDDLDFIWKTANYLLALVNHKYGVQVSMFKILNPQTAPEAAPG